MVRSTWHLFPYYVFTITFLVVVGANERTEGVCKKCVTIDCVGCELNNGGVVGGNITLRYTFPEDFDELKITYNETKILIVRGLEKYALDTRHFNDPRLSAQRSYKEGGVKVDSFTLTLVGLTTDDNGCVFKYIYKKEVDGEGGILVKGYDLPPTQLNVRKPEDQAPSTGDDASDSLLIIIIVVVSIVVLIGCFIGVLLKSGVLQSGIGGGRHTKDPRKYNSHGRDPHGEMHPLGPGGGAQMYQPDEKIYATPDHHHHHHGAPGGVEQLMEYAEVGPGGGRLEDHKHNEKQPDPSCYAQVKTESGNYPDLQHSRRGDRL